MRAIWVGRIVAHIRTGKEDSTPPTIPVCVDNSAAIVMNNSDNTSKRVRHVESRHWFGQSACQKGLMKLIKVDGKTQQPADLGTKNVQEVDARLHLNMFEVPHCT